VARDKQVEADLGNSKDKKAGEDGDQNHDEDIEDVEDALIKPLIPLSQMHQVHGDMDSPFEKLNPPDVVVSAGWIKSVERNLEGLLWKINRQLSDWERFCVYVADPAKAGLKSADKVVMLGAPEDVNLLYCGPVSTMPSTQSKKLTVLPNLIEFHVHPPASPPSADVIVPAWLSKPTNKKEHVTLKQVTTTLKVFIDADGSVFLDDPSHLWQMCEYSNTLDQLLTDAEREMKTLREKCKTYKLKAKEARDQLKVQAHDFADQNAPEAEAVAEVSTAPTLVDTTPETDTTGSKVNESGGDEPVASVAAPRHPEHHEENSEKKSEIETNKTAQEEGSKPNHDDAEEAAQEQAKQLEIQSVASPVQEVPNADVKVADTVADPDSEDKTSSGVRSRPTCWWKWQKNRTSLPPSVLAVDLNLTMHLVLVD